MRKRPVDLLVTGFLIGLLLVGDFALGAQEVLDVWTPGRSRSHYRDKMSVPFLEKLQEVTGRKVRLNGSSDPAALLKACAEYRADHVLVNHLEGQLFIEQYGYQLIAYGDARTGLYTKVSLDKPVASLDSIGFLRRTGMDEAIVRELKISGLEKRLVEFPSDSTGIKSLFADKIEALIISQHLVKQLAPGLRDQLVLRLPLKTPGRVMVLVSPRLAPELIESLKELYLSDDPVIEDLFHRRAGLTVHPPEDLEKGDAGPMASPVSQ